ncbi:MAG: DUF3108 domain-containing protein [Muribaculaceae bacterium]|nr:DUF3108 domain-containing protein [Muribaculaceae bacterium]
MNKFLKIFLAVFVVLLGRFSANAATKFDNETLKYVITYKWGLITKDSGDATLTLKNQGSKYYITLTGKTRPWADGLFKVRDTLVSVMDKAKFRPISYTKIAHEGSSYLKDVIEYSFSGNKVSGKGSVYKDKKGQVTSSDLNLSATGDTFDMLSVFYWIRSVDVANMVEGKKMTATLFSGSHEETVKIWKVGEGVVKMRDGSKRDAWHLKFTFTSKGGKKTSDDIDVWISKDNKRVPLEIKGSLPIGHASAYLISE